MPAAYFSVLQNPSRRNKLLIAAILVLWLVTLFRVISVLGPDSIHTSYNSDGAIPIIMANEQLHSLRPLLLCGGKVGRLANDNRTINPPNNWLPVDA